MAKDFSTHAREKLLDLYKHHDKEVGSELKLAEPQLYKDFKATNCITYAINVLSYAFQKTGNSDAAKKVRGLGKHGNELSRYLVNVHQWRGIYINADVRHPRDADPEHPWSDRLVNKKCSYFGIPITYRAVNYSPTPKNHPEFQALNKNAPLTALNLVDLKVLNWVDFGFGISRGARHTWLFSLGNVYEVHWDKVGAKLYEKTLLPSFGWLSGAIVVPPDRNAALRLSAQTCARASR